MGSYDDGGSRQFADIKAQKSDTDIITSHTQLANEKKNRIKIT